MVETPTGREDEAKREAGRYGFCACGAPANIAYLPPGAPGRKAIPYCDECWQKVQRGEAPATS